jgi:replicative DNA helicase
MHHGQLLFSKVIDANDVQALTRFGITKRHFDSEGDRQVLRFLTDYSEKNQGQAPSYAEVSAQCPDFNYTPMVGDSYEYLAKEIKKHSAKVQFAELVNGKLSQASKFEASRTKRYIFVVRLVAIRGRKY